jgi:hypothetical protein
MDINCPACRPREDEELCDDCRRILARGGHTLVFLLMEAGFGAGIALAAVRTSYIALGLFVVAAVLSTVLVVK